MPFDKSKTFDLTYSSQSVYKPKPEVVKSKPEETQARIVTSEPSHKKDSTAIDVGNYVFQSEFKSKKKKEEPIENKSVTTDTVKTIQEQVNLQPDSSEENVTSDSAIFRCQNSATTIFHFPLTIFLHSSTTVCSTQPISHTPVVPYILIPE